MNKLNIYLNNEEIDLVSDLVRNEREISLMDSDKEYIKSKYRS